MWDTFKLGTGSKKQDRSATPKQNSQVEAITGESYIDIYLRNMIFSRLDPGGSDKLVFYQNDSSGLKPLDGDATSRAIKPEKAGTLVNIFALPSDLLSKTNKAVYIEKRPNQNPHDHLERLAVACVFSGVVPSGEEAHFPLTPAKIMETSQSKGGTAVTDEQVKLAIAEAQRAKKVTKAQAASNLTTKEVDGFVLPLATLVKSTSNFHTTPEAMLKAFKVVEESMKPKKLSLTALKAILDSSQKELRQIKDKVKDAAFLAKDDLSKAKIDEQIAAAETLSQILDEHIKFGFVELSSVEIDYLQGFIDNPDKLVEGGKDFILHAIEKGIKQIRYGDGFITPLEFAIVKGRLIDGMHPVAWMIKRDPKNASDYLKEAVDKNWAMEIGGQNLIAVTRDESITLSTSRMGLTSIQVDLETYVLLTKPLIEPDRVKRKEIGIELLANLSDEQINKIIKSEGTMVKVEEALNLKSGEIYEILINKGKKIENIDPTVWALENGKFSARLIKYAFGNSPVYDSVLSKIAENDKSRAKLNATLTEDPRDLLILLSQKKVTIGGLDPVIWALENEKEIGGMKAADYVDKHNIKFTDKGKVAQAGEVGMTFYHYQNLSLKLCIENDTPYVYMDGNSQISVEPIRYAIENGKTALLSGLEKGIKSRVNARIASMYIDSMVQVKKQGDRIKEYTPANEWQTKLQKAHSVVNGTEVLIGEGSGVDKLVNDSVTPNEIAHHEQPSDKDEIFSTFKDGILANCDLYLIYKIYEVGQKAIDKSADQKPAKPMGPIDRFCSWLSSVLGRKSCPQLVKLAASELDAGVGSKLDIGIGAMLPENSREQTDTAALPKGKAVSRLSTQNPIDNGAHK